MDIRDAYKQKMAAQLREWTAQINLLEAKAEHFGADMKVKQAEALQELRAQQRAASEKLTELEKASGAAWDEIKTTVDKIWDDLKKSIADAHAKFK